MLFANLIKIYNLFHFDLPLSVDGYLLSLSVVSVSDCLLSVAKCRCMSGIVCYWLSSVRIVSVSDCLLLVVKRR
jgi:hypothetical protein